MSTTKYALMEKLRKLSQNYQQILLFNKSSERQVFSRYCSYILHNLWQLVCGCFYVTWLLKLSFLFSLKVSKYTREAGVRTFERRIAAVCRAVAVRVAESAVQSKKEKLESVSTEKKKVVNDNLTDKERDATALAHPPEMPIVIDEAAIEDILGVGIKMYTYVDT